MRRALDSILAQELDHELELIVVDGGSTDGTLDVLDAYRQCITTLISEPDDGMYDAMNKGIRCATGDVVGILNADDHYVDPLVLRDVMRTFENDDTQACYGDLYIEEEDGTRCHYWTTGNAKLRYVAASRFYVGWCPPHPSFFVRRSLYERYGLYRLDIPIEADKELILRMMVKHKAKSKYIPRPLVIFARGGFSWVTPVRKTLWLSSEKLYGWRVNFKYRWLVWAAGTAVWRPVVAPTYRAMRSLFGGLVVNKAS